MLKSLVRIVVFLLVPCLVIDPAFAIATNFQGRVYTATPHSMGIVFEEMAVNPAEAASQYSGDGNFDSKAREAVIAMVPHTHPWTVLQFIRPFILSLPLILSACGVEGGGDVQNDHQAWVNAENAIHHTQPILDYSRPPYNIKIYSNFPGQDLSDEDLNLIATLFNSIPANHLKGLRDLVDVDLGDASVFGYAVSAISWTGQGITAINGPGYNPQELQGNVSHEIGQYVTVHLPDHSSSEYRVLYRQSTDTFADFVDGTNWLSYYFWLQGDYPPSYIPLGSYVWYEDLCSVYANWLGSSGSEGYNPHGVRDHDPDGLPVAPLSFVLEALYRASHGHPLLLQKELFIASLFADPQRQTVSFFDIYSPDSPEVVDQRSFVRTTQTLQLGYITFLLNTQNEILEAKAPEQSFNVDGESQEQDPFDIVFDQPIPIPQAVLDRVPLSASMAIPSNHSYDRSIRHGSRRQPSSKPRRVPALGSGALNIGFESIFLLPSLLFPFQRLRRSDIVDEMDTLLLGDTEARDRLSSAGFKFVATVGGRKGDVHPYYVDYLIQNALRDWGFRDTLLSEPWYLGGMPVELITALGFAVQECATNILNYAKPGRGVVIARQIIEGDREGIEIMIRDLGQGFENFLARIKAPRSSDMFKQGSIGLRTARYYLVHDRGGRFTVETRGRIYTYTSFSNARSELSPIQQGTLITFVRLARAA